MKKALIVRLSSLGDVIFNVPLANVLKNNGYEVTWIVSEKGIDIVKDNPAVDNAILIPLKKWKKNRLSLKNWCEFFTIVKKLRAEKFDIAIDTQMMLKTAIWMFLSGAKRKLGYSYGREWSTLAVKEKVHKPQTPDFQVHAVYQHLQFAKHLGLKDEVKFTLPPSAVEVIEKVDNLLKDVDKSKPMVIISPATTWKLKHWNKDNWRTVVDAIKDKCSLVFTGMECDRELISYIGGDNYVNLVGKTNIKDMIEIFSRADIVMAPDSGSAHVARATEKPAVVAIFCCTPPKMYGPFGDDKKYFAVGGNLKCQPCHTRICPLKGEDAEKCVNYPNPEEIINIVNMLLQNVRRGV